jgi:HAD superfamily hydrolase (TIGR01509 family)
MTRPIETIFFDTGNTLRVVEQDAAFQQAARNRLAELVGTRQSPEALLVQLEERYQQYKKRARATLFQASEAELWTRWMLPDHPADRVAELAGRLTRLWHDCDGRRVPRPDAKATLFELHKRGYILGIIANAISATEIPDWLKDDGLTEVFKAVILSSEFGRRKPDPHIFLEAASAAGVKPAACAYVGDNPVRDVQGARQAGFGMVLILQEAKSQPAATLEEKHRPDVFLRSCSALLDHFR